MTIAVGHFSYIRIMSNTSANHLNLIIDDLTNSIRHIVTGKSYETDILPVTILDIKTATKKNRWHFPWNTEFKHADRAIYKLIKKDQPEILQGLISLSENRDHVYVHLAESAPINFGSQKQHEGVGGNLFAYACKLSWDKGNDGIIAFQSKTKLIKHYQQTLGAVHIGGHQMIIYPESALILIKQYFSN